MNEGSLHSKHCESNTWVVRTHQFKIIRKKWITNVLDSGGTAKL